jgi:hypothetical protein
VSRHVRAEHAAQAAKLISFSWTKPGSDEQIYLLADLQLRESYGEQIGLIAASHHWGVAELSRRLHVEPLPAANP